MAEATRNSNERHNTDNGLVAEGIITKTEKKIAKESDSYIESLAQAIVAEKELDETLRKKIAEYRDKIGSSILEYNSTNFGDLEKKLEDEDYEKTLIRVKNGKFTIARHQRISGENRLYKIIIEAQSGEKGPDIRFNVRPVFRGGEALSASYDSLTACVDGMDDPEAWAILKCIAAVGLGAASIGLYVDKPSSPVTAGFLAGMATTYLVYPGLRVLGHYARKFYHSRQSSKLEALPERIKDRDIQIAVMQQVENFSDYVNSIAKDKFIEFKKNIDELNAQKTRSEQHREHLEQS